MFLLCLGGKETIAPAELFGTVELSSDQQDLHTLNTGGTVRCVSCHLNNLKPLSRQSFKGSLYALYRWGGGGGLQPRCR